MVRPGHGTTDWFQIGKGVHQAVYYHPAYLTYIKSTSGKNPGCMKHKLESRLPGGNNINLRYADDTILMIEIKEEFFINQRPLDESERGE